MTCFRVSKAEVPSALISATIATVYVRVLGTGKRYWYSGCFKPLLHHSSVFALSKKPRMRNQVLQLVALWLQVHIVARRKRKIEREWNSQRKRNKAMKLLHHTRHYFIFLSLVHNFRFLFFAVQKHFFSRCMHFWSSSIQEKLFNKSK